MHSKDRFCESLQKTGQKKHLYFLRRHYPSGLMGRSRTSSQQQLPRFIYYIQNFSTKQFKVQAKYEFKKEFTNETIQKIISQSFQLSIFLIFLTMAISPYVIVSGYDNSLSHILFFESLMTTNLIVPFALNTIYLVYLLFKTILSQDNQCLFWLLN